ncbi:MAG TPA: prepilin-type N-terminal cleavage/methylation domain-containing protein [Ruminiclostridium sp.]
MLKFFKKMKKNRKGYTLTELIVVVAILGILAAVATPMIMNQVDKARTTADLANAKSIENAYKIEVVSTGVEASDAAAAITAIKKTLVTIPAPQKAGAFYLNPKTGETKHSAATPTVVAGETWFLVSP